MSPEAGRSPANGAGGRSPPVALSPREAKEVKNGERGTGQKGGGEVKAFCLGFSRKRGEQ